MQLDLYTEEQDFYSAITGWPLAVILMGLVHFLPTAGLLAMVPGEVLPGLAPLYLMAALAAIAAGIVLGLWCLIAPRS